MSEEKEKAETKTELSSDDIKAMEDDARKASQAEARAIAEDVEKKVRKEISQEQALENLKKEKARQDAELKRIKEEQEQHLNSLKEEFENRIKNVEEARKSTVKSENPYRSRSDDEKKELLSQLKDPQVMKDIEEQSRAEFLKKYPHLSEAFGQPY
jgi:hypothetical protein